MQFFKLTEDLRATLRAASLSDNEISTNFVNNRTATVQTFKNKEELIRVALSDGLTQGNSIETIAIVCFFDLSEALQLEGGDFDGCMLNSVVDYERKKQNPNNEFYIISGNPEDLGVTFESVQEEKPLKQTKKYQPVPTGDLPNKKQDSKKNKEKNDYLAPIKATTRLRNFFFCCCKGAANDDATEAKELVSKIEDNKQSDAKTLKESAVYVITEGGESSDSSPESSKNTR